MSSAYYFDRLELAIVIALESLICTGAPAKAFNLSLPEYRSYVVQTPGHPREKKIRAFAGWLR
jgi:hypothetical protein